MPLEKGIDLKQFAKRTEGYSGADLEAFCREAGMNALRENQAAKTVAKAHFEKAFDSVKPLREQERRRKETELKRRSAELDDEKAKVQKETQAMRGYG